MTRRLVATVALCAAGVIGCSRFEVPQPTVSSGAASGRTTSTVRADPPHAPTAGPGPDGVRLRDLPPGWSTATGRAPTALVSVLPRLATCLGRKLVDVAGDALRDGEPAFRSADGKEWLSGSAGPALAESGRTIPPSPDAAVRLCGAEAVATDLVAGGVASPHVRSVSVVTSFTSLLPRALDLRVTIATDPQGVPTTTFVDLVWIADDRTTAIFDIVDETAPGDLPSADDGLIAQATDAVGRRIVGL